MEIIWYHFGNGICLGIRHIKYPGHITYYSLCLQCSKGYNLCHMVFSIFSSYIINNFLSSFNTKVHVNIRHGNSFRIKESLKNQIISHWLYICNLKAIRHNASCCRASSRAYGNSAGFGKMNKIPYNKEIFNVTHTFYCIKFIIKSVF